MSAQEAGRLTLTMFTKLYNHYKDSFDLELRLRMSSMTYADAAAQLVKSEEWF